MLRCALLAASAMIPAERPIWRGGETEGLELVLRRDPEELFSYEVSVNGTTWLTSSFSAFELRASGINHTAGDQTLKPVSYGPVSSTSAGSGGIGNFTGFKIVWTVASAVGRLASLPCWETEFRFYPASKAIGFRQTFLTKITGFAWPGDPNRGSHAVTWGKPGSSFPTFDATGRAKLGGADGLGFVSYGEIGVPAFGRFPGRYKLDPNYEDGVGVNSPFRRLSSLPSHPLSSPNLFSWQVPLAFLDTATTAAMVLAPAQGFYDTVYDYAGGNLRCGLAGTLQTLPRGFVSESLIHSDPDGLTGAMMATGDTLLLRHGKRRTAFNANVQVHKLGYSTVGHYFYGLELGANAAATLESIKRAAADQGLPPFG